MDEAMFRLGELAEQFDHVPFFFACDVGIATVRRRALDAGATAFLEKPSPSSMQWHEQMTRSCETAMPLAVEHHRGLSAQIEALVSE